MSIAIIQPQFIDFAWEDGANCLSEACDLTDDVTGDQLKLILSRGERTLARIEDDGKTIGWGAFMVSQLPNMRVLHVTSLVCHNGGFERFFVELNDIAASLGCFEIRVSAPPAQTRLYRMKCGFQPAYETSKVKVKR